MNILSLYSGGSAHQPTNTGLEREPTIYERSLTCDACSLTSGTFLDVSEKFGISSGKLKDDPGKFDVISGKFPADPGKFPVTSGELDSIPSPASLQKKEKR